MCVCTYICVFVSRASSSRIFLLGVLKFSSPLRKGLAPNHTVAFSRKLIHDFLNNFHFYILVIQRVNYQSLHFFTQH